MRRYLLLAVAALVGLPGCRAGGLRETQKVARLTSAVARTPEQIRREGNHLVGAGSAYLRQHSHNPVDWYSWGPEPLALAVKLDRPIFLSIGYVSCHWCHVMEKEVFEKDDVAEFLNAHFVSIKVDREERPDLDSAYMEAVQEMSGNGGWPMTVILTPALRPFFGGTYFPREQFLEVTRSAEEQFRTTRKEVERGSAEVFHRIGSAERPIDGDGMESEELHAIAKRALEDLDPIYGGFRGGTKFPTPIRWRFLLDAYRKWGDLEVGSAVRRTLDAMASGGIHDQVGGGFFRYSTEPTWTIPHFEKMLYDNAQLAALYLEAGAALDEPRYRTIGLDTLEFLRRDMSTPERGFGASFDADTQGKEGATYLFTPSALRAIAGDADGRALAELLGVTDRGNFEGSNVPTARGTPLVDAPLWAEWRPRLLEARQHRAQPSFDSKLVTAWNGLAISALATGYRASGDPQYLDAAEAAAKAIFRLNRRPSGELTRTSDDGRAGESAVLDDYALLASALVDLFEVTTNASYLERAVSLTTDAMTRFANPAGGWFLTSGTDQEPLGRRMELSDGVEPSGNAALLSVLERLAAFTGRTELDDAVAKTLRIYAPTMRRRGLDMAGWLGAALLHAGPFYEVVVAGDPGRLWETWNRLLPAWTVGVRVPPSGPGAEVERVMPPAAGKHANGSTAVAYVCVRGSCKAPVSDAAKFRASLLLDWSH